MSGTWTSGICAACRAPVVVCGAGPDDGDGLCDYVWRCPNGHHEEATGDTDVPWWCLSPTDARTEAEVVEVLAWEAQWLADAKAAADAQDWPRHDALCRERVARTLDGRRR